MSTQTDETPENLKLAQKMFRKGAFAEAIDLFNRVLEDDPNSIKAHRGVAAAWYQTGNEKKAIEHYTRITTLDLRTGTAWLNLGAIYLMRGDFPKVVEVVRKGMLKEKRSAIGFFYLAEANSGMGETNMAISGYKEALKIDPNLLDAHIGMGNLYLSMKNLKLAENHFQSALKINPQSKRAELGMQKLRADLNATEFDDSPFGRLVDVEKMELKGHVAVNRVLSSEERLMDRQQVRALATELATISQECLTQLTTDLESSVLGMNRALAEGGSAPAHILTAFEKFHDSVERCMTIRKNFRRKILEIRAHEELTNTPDFDFGDFSKNADE